MTSAGLGHFTSRPWIWPANSASRWRRRTRWPGLGRCAQATGRTNGAEDRLRQALAILQRIGAAETVGVSAELDALPGTPDPAPASP